MLWSSKEMDLDSVSSTLKLFKWNKAIKTYPTDMGHWHLSLNGGFLMFCLIMDSVKARSCDQHNIILDALSSSEAITQLCCPRELTEEVYYAALRDKEKICRINSAPRCLAKHRLHFCIAFLFFFSFFTYSSLTKCKSMSRAACIPNSSAACTKNCCRAHFLSTPST